MLELGACMEKEKSSELGENRDEFAEITFEELLAQEKKDSFWLVSFCSSPFVYILEGKGWLQVSNNHFFLCLHRQRNGKSRLSSS